MNSNFKQVYVNSIGMEFVTILPSKFMMGSEFEEDEMPVHQRNIVDKFQLSRYLVTQEQWYELMHTDPSNFKGGTRPVENVSWYDANEFIAKLNSIEGTDIYRLPSEAEWEYACRADDTEKNISFSFGNDEKQLDKYCWYVSNSCGMTQPVGQKKANCQGLYDMHGNVWEWCHDRWHDDYTGAPTDNRPWDEGQNEGRVIRGGCWHSYPDFCRATKRYCILPGERHYSLGFRVLRQI